MVAILVILVRSVSFIDEILSQQELGQTELGDRRDAITSIGTAVQQVVIVAGAQRIDDDVVRQVGYRNDLLLVQILMPHDCGIHEQGVIPPGFADGDFGVFWQTDLKRLPDC